eukprot:scaffold257793_cov35-Attheya_sp.AAC.1
MGLPVGAVQNALTRDGKDPAIMDMDPEKSLEYHLKVAERKKSKAPSGGKKKEKKPKVRRKKIFWTPIEKSKVHEDSIWSLVQGTVNMQNLTYDSTEFENLFTDTTDPKKKKANEPKKSGEGAPKEKKSVQFVDGKRGMNGGIILARIKLTYEQMATMVDEMDSGELDTTQLNALKDFLPTEDELQAMSSYIESNSSTEEAKATAIEDMCAVEKYMYAMKDVQKAAEKFDCMTFRVNFQSRLDDLFNDISTMTRACDQVRISLRLRKMMGFILTVGNQINTGGTGNVAAGFSLDALLKLDEAKAFDKKTSVLQYLVKLVKHNDDALLKFKDEIHAVKPAESITLDSLGGDIKAMREELDKVMKTASVEAERVVGDKEEVEKMTLEKLAEQKSYVRKIGNLSHYNQVTVNNGRTQMERFTIEADRAVQQLLDTSDHVKKKYTNVLRYFGEDEKMPSNEFFGTINKFVATFDKAVGNYEKREAIRLKEEKKLAAQNAKEAKKLAAQQAKEAAAKAADGEESQSNDEDVKTEAIMNGSGPASHSPFPPGALAAAAAAAANAKQHLTQMLITPDGFPVPVLAPAPAPRGIAAMAAAAARLQEEGDKPHPSIGIGAAAAAAARSREATPITDSDIGVGVGGDTGMPAGGIAAAAAAAALKRKPKSSQGPPPGGIAAATALAARSRPQRSMAMPPGGMAAAAAAAARSREATPITDSDVGVGVGEGEGGATGIPAGGIAAAAAAAALKRKPKSSQGPPPGGIAAATALAARSRPQRSMAMPPGGMAAAAAAAARSREATPTTESNPSTSGGIAAAAAFAARNKQDGSQQPPLGGIAGAAAAGERERSQTDGLPPPQ